MELSEYKELYEDSTLPVGWEAITNRLKAVYGDAQDRHYPAPLHYIAGGDDPLDGVSIYDNNTQTFHRHMVGFGMTELYYDEEAFGKDYSKWGFEFTFRVAPFDDDNGDPLWAIQVMNNLARYVFNSGNYFEEFHICPAGGPIRINTDIEIVALVFDIDPELGIIETPHGEVKFLQMYGITAAELEQLSEDPTFENVERFLDEVKKTNPLLITDLKRKS